MLQEIACCKIDLGTTCGNNAEEDGPSNARQAPKIAAATKISFLLSQFAKFPYNRSLYVEVYCAIVNYENVMPN